MVRKGRDCDKGKLGSICWKDLMILIAGVGLGVGSWFNDNLGRVVDYGSFTLFWWDLWLEGGHLCVRFRLVFDLAENKLLTIEEISDLGWEVEENCGNGDNSCWLRECDELLTSIILQDDVTDKWLRHLELAKYTRLTKSIIYCYTGELSELGTNII